ncbi:hypothetical protein FRC16_007543, partial [Serendipita sp. 398]
MSDHTRNDSSPSEEVRDGDSPPGTSNDTRKEPSLVVVACRQCRSRKVRCNSERPHCRNCARRSENCEYDSLPKRRGPDKQPGTRKRMYKKKPQGLAPSGTSPTAQTTSEDGEADAPRKTKRVKQIENLNPKSSQASALSVHQSRDIGTEVISRNLDPPPVIRVDDADLDVTIRQAGFGTLSHLLWQTTTESQSQLFINDDFDCH